MRLLGQAVWLVHFILLPQSMEVSIVDIGQIRSKYLDSAKGLSVSQSVSLLEMGNGINNSLSCFKNKFKLLGSYEKDVVK